MQRSVRRDRPYPCSRAMEACGRYLTKKYLKKQNLRDFLHVIAPSKTSYELRCARSATAGGSELAGAEGGKFHEHHQLWIRRRRFSVTEIANTRKLLKAFWGLDRQTPGPCRHTKPVEVLQHQ